MRAQEFLKEDTAPAQAWIDRVYAKYPGTWQNNHVIIYGEGEDQSFAAFELKAVDTKTVDIVWLQAYPQRQGVGSRALAELQALARADGITLTLIPWAHGRVSPASLTKFYKRSGFKPRAKGARNMVWTPEVNEAKESLSIATKRQGKKFSTQMMLDGTAIGSYEYNETSGRSLAEIDPKYQGKGYGKILVLHAIYTAAVNGLDFVEDESRTAAYDAVLDSLWSEGLIIEDDGYWYVTEQGEQYLKDTL